MIRFLKGLEGCGFYQGYGFIATVLTATVFEAVLGAAVKKMHAVTYLNRNA